MHTDPFDAADVGELTAQEFKLGGCVQALHIKRSGLELDVDRRWLFVREEVVKLHTFLDELPLSHTALVQGPPGTGKSVSVWLWALYQAFVKNQSIFWMHQRSAGSRFCYCWLSPQGFRNWTSMEACSQVPDGCRVFVLDGLAATTVRLVLEVTAWVRVQPATRRGVCVTSMAFCLPDVDFGEGNFLETDVLPWRFEEYEQACKHPPLLAQVHVQRALEGVSEMVLDDSGNPKVPSLEQMLHDKFFFAGTSARYMFTFPVDRLLSLLKLHMGRPNDFQSVLDGRVGDRSNAAVNHLFNWNDRGNFFQPASRYIARSLAARCSNAFITGAYAHCDGNQSMRGWLFQMDYARRQAAAAKGLEPLMVIPRTKRLSEGQREAAVEWRINNVIDFKHPSMMAPHEIITVNTAFNPTKINQGCYDFATLVTMTKLRVIQCFVGPVHDMKYGHLLPLLEYLSQRGIFVSSLEIVFLIPASTPEVELGSTESSRNAKLYAYNGNKPLPNEQNYDEIRVFGLETPF